MADRYVGIGGNDGNNGLTWALRKLTLNGAEDTPVVAGDVVYVGPGVYRETLTVDVAGAGGNPITYIGDVTGEHTDEIGGVVRITGSDNDTTITRSWWINGSGFERDYRTFRGFCFDMANPGGNQGAFWPHDSSDWIAEDCSFFFSSDSGDACVYASGNSVNFILRRCFFLLGAKARGIFFNTGSETSVDHLYENNIFIGPEGSHSISINKGYDIDIKNCAFLCADTAINVGNIDPAGTVNVYNCILTGCENGMLAAVLGEIIENYNAFFGNNADRTNVAVGGNSNAYPALWSLPLLFDGVVFPWWFGQLSEWSQIDRIAGTSEATDDLYGIARPTTSAKKSWGPVQLREGQRETGTVRTGVASINLADAGDHQIFVPVDDVEMTISVYVYREANYAGVNPRMIVRQPGQADDVTTDAGGAAGWNLLTTTLTPSADTDYVIVILRSLNTAAAGNYDVFFDDLDVT